MDSNLASEQFLTGGETGKLMRSINWLQTPLGGSNSWSPHFKTTVGLCLNSPSPAIVWWGPELTELHNDRFRTLLGGDYTASFGKQGAQGHAGIWNISAPLIAKVMAQKQALISENNPLYFHPATVTDDHYYTFIYHPVYAASGDVEGVFATIQETTPQVKINKELNEAEQRLRLAIEAAEVGTFDWDMLTLEFIYSERLARMFGFTALTGLSHRDFGAQFHAEDQLKRAKAHDEAITTGVLFYELRLVWPDASIHWVRTRGKILYNEEGKPVRMYGISLDITEQKTQSDQLEKKVAERTRQLLVQNDEIIHQKQFMDTIIDTSVDYICAIDLEEKILLFNKKYEDQSGYKREDLIGRKITAVFPHLEETEAGRKGLSYFHEALKGNPVHIEKDHSPAMDRFFESFYIPLKSYSGEVFGTMMLAHDITERIRAEEKLIRANEELTTSNQRLEQFAYVASHDLQEPLRKIQTFAELVHKNFNNKEESEKYFNKIISSAQRMSSLIKDVLAYSRLSDTDVIFKEIDLDQIVENVKVDFELLIAQKHAVIESDKLPVIKGIPLQLNQLFSNLIGNSLKFSKETPRIKITSRRLPASEIMNNLELNPELNYVQLTFEDNGIGFDQQYANQIFTIFQRLNDRQSYSGTGIGLALCKKIVENHHGFITASSEPGKGAKFAILLPLF